MGCPLQTVEEVAKQTSKYSTLSVRMGYTYAHQHRISSYKDIVTAEIRRKHMISIHTRYIYKTLRDHLHVKLKTLQEPANLYHVFMHNSYTMVSASYIFEDAHDSVLQGWRVASNSIDKKRGRICKHASQVPDSERRILIYASGLPRRSRLKN